MSLQENSQLLKALADPSRLRIAGALLQKAHYVEELAERLGLAASTVSSHLKKLEAAGVVQSQREQYYIVYSLRREKLDIRLLDLLDNREADDERRRLERYRDKVLRVFMKDGRLTKLPAQHKKRWIVYEEILGLFEPGRRYQERELNELIQTVFDDYCTVRRELVDEGALRREDRVYWRPEDTARQAGGFQRSYEESVTTTS